MMKAYISGNQIDLKADDINKLAYTEYNEELWKKVKDINWTVQKNKEGEPKYLYSSKLRKYLHQLVIEHYFGEDALKEAYKADMIIEHLDNNGFNCQISNLYFLKKIYNTCKGMSFDIESKKAIPILSLRVFHIIKNHTFQITIAFNAEATHSSSEKHIQSIAFLYDCDYWIVIQDAEVILERFLKDGGFDLSNPKGLYRYKDYKIEFAPQIALTEEEIKAGVGPGNFIWREGRPLLLVGDVSKILVVAVAPVPNWDV